MMPRQPFPRPTRAELRAWAVQAVLLPLEIACIGAALSLIAALALYVDSPWRT